MAQPAAATTNPALNSEDDLAHGQVLLENIRDDVFSFDDPAFYWFCQYVRRHASASEFQPDSMEKPLDGTSLLERPHAFRGRVVMIEGILRAKRSYEVSNRREGGTLHQYEVELSGGRLCAVISPAEEFGLPIGNRVRATGYFIKIRRYQTMGGRESSGPLIIAPRLTPVDPGSGRKRSPEEPNYANWVVGGTAALAIFWLMLRRTLAHRSRPTGHSSNAGKIASSTKQDFDWLLKQESSGDESGSSQRAHRR